MKTTTKQSSFILPMVGKQMNGWLAYSLTLLLIFACIASSRAQNNALHFDGVNDHVTGSGMSIASSSFTVEAWINSNATAGGQALISVGTLPAPGFQTSKALHIVLNPTNVLVGFYNNDVTINWTKPSGWNHVAVVFNTSGNTSTLYLNGSLVGSGTHSGGAFTGDGAFWIGRTGFSADYFSGRMDEFRVWNTARSQANIQSNMYTSFTGSEANLLAYYNFNQGTAGGSNAGVTTLTDLATTLGGTNTGTLNNFALTGNTSNWVGGINNALNFDGGNDYVMVSDNNNLDFGSTNSFTLEAWVRYSVSMPDYTGLVVKGNASGSWSGYQMLLVNNKIATEIRDGTNMVSAQGTTSLNDGTWHHLAMVVTRVSNNVKLYVDGIQEASVTNAFLGNNIDNSANLLIGVERTNALYLGGNIDEVRVWNVARTCAEIKSTKDRELVGNETGLVAYYNFNQGIAGGTNTGLTTLSDRQTNVTANNGTLTNFALTGTTSNWVDGSGNGVSGTTPVAQPEINIQGNSTSITDGDNTPSITDHTDFGTVSVGNSIVRTFTIQNTGGGILNISSITSNNAKFVISGAPTTVAASSSATFTVTYTPTALLTDNATITINNNDCDEAVYDFTIQGNLNNALNFDGTNDHVNIPYNSSLDIASALTLSAWIKVNGAGTFRNILLKGNYGYGFGIDFSNQLGYWSDPSYTNCPRFGTISTNTWTHVAVVIVKNVSATFYINGVQVGQSTNPLHTTINLGGASSNMFLGIQGTGCTCNYFNGDMDEVSVWNVARTCDQINAVKDRELVGNETGLVAYYNFNQGIAGGTNTGLTTLSDRQTNVTANNGTLTNFALTGTTSNWVDGSGNGVSGTTPVAQPEINVTVGTNGSTKDVGGYSTGTNNDFTYTVQNIGGASLSLTGSPRVFVSGATNATFTVTTQPLSIINAGGSSNFTIRVTPTGALGSTFSALFTITNSDCDEGSYTFTITGKVINATPSGTRGNMMSFTGTSNQSINVANGGGLNNLQTGSIEMWVKWTGTQPSGGFNSSFGVVLSRQLDFSFSNQVIGLNGSNPATANIIWRVDNANVNTITSSVTAGNDTWNHIAIVYSSGSHIMYVNGIQVGTSTATSSITNNSSVPLSIGAWQGGGGSYSTSSIDELRIWNTVRSQAQIRDNMHLTLSGSESGLVTYYQFNEVSGNAIDAIAGNNGSLQNGATRTTSTVSVAKGVSNRQTVNAVGNYSFTGTNCSLNFSGTLPAGEIVVNRLEGTVSGTQLGGNANYSRHYWVINNYGTNTGLTVTPTFVLGSNQISANDVATPNNLRLNKRPTNNGGSWTQFAGTSANATTGSVTFNNINSFSEFGVVTSGTSPLPITLVGLKGERVTGGQDNRFTEEVKLTWTTAQEINNKGFEVEMSENALTYEKIAFVEGMGSSNTPKHYTLNTINPNDAYYRLKQVDFDGKFSYSPVVFVEGVNLTKVYPNPNNGAFTISVGEETLDAPARLLNAQGKEVWCGTQTEVRTTGLPTGIYFLHTTVAGKTKITKVVIYH